MNLDQLEPTTIVQLYLGFTGYKELAQIARWGGWAFKRLDPPPPQQLALGPGGGRPPPQQLALGPGGVTTPRPALGTKS